MSLPNYLDYFDAGFTKDVASYLIAAQIGVLAIVSVAVGVVTLLSERNDGASINTDIRLYYFESYAYEVAISGIALLLVLVIQLFWPAHQLLRAWNVVQHDYWFKLCVSVVHAAWFCLNLFLFLQFITTTLRFVEPSRREALRERYTANEVIPRDATMRVLRTLYADVPSQAFGRKELKDGPLIAFGYHFGDDDSAHVEIEGRFRVPSVLVDVYLRPLCWALGRWQKRVRQTPRRTAQFGQPFWRDHISVVPNFEDAIDDRDPLVVRHSDVALTWIERLAIRHSFRFAPVASSREDMPGPNDFLEQLIDKLVEQIDQAAGTGFRATLKEVIRYHTFILATQSSRDGEGNAFNYAEVGGYFSKPDADWVRQYRRAFIVAADKIGSDTTFINFLGAVASRLIPKDGLEFSRSVVESVLEMGLYELLALEDWLTRRAVIGSEGDHTSSPSLTGSDKRAYEDVLISFVGSWENLLQDLIRSYSIKRRLTGHEADQGWSAFSYSLPVLQTHLYHAAYFLAAAVWNDDAQGADRYRDSLLRWLQPFYENLQQNYLFSTTLLLTPELVGKPWSSVKTEVTSQMRFGQESIAPGPVSGVVLWEMQCDVVCVSGLIALHWYATNPRRARTAADVAVLTLGQKKRESDGSDLTSIQPKTTFRLIFDFVIRYALNPRLGDGSYSATTDALIRRLTELASPRMVAGRIYGGVGIEGFDTLRTVALASLAANLPVAGDDGVGALIDSLKMDSHFADYRVVQNFIWTMQQMSRSLSEVRESEVYSKAAYLFRADLDLAAATTQLQSIFSNVVATFSAMRADRLRAAPLDEDRLQLVRRAMSNSILEDGPEIAFFRTYEIRSTSEESIPVMRGEFRAIDKGSFTKPVMSAIEFNEMPPIFVRAIRSILGQLVWRELYTRPKRVLAIDVSGGNDLFWQSAVAEASSVGPDPILIVPFEPIGTDVTTAKIYQHQLAGFAVSVRPKMPRGAGAAYLGTIENVDIFGASLPRDKAILCSGRLLQSICYGTVHGMDDVADFSFVEGEDLENCTIELQFAQRIQWSDDVFVEYSLRYSSTPDNTG